MTLDGNIRPLVDALNAFEGITTFGSCGGHKNPKPGQWPRGRWYVKFDVAQNAHGWRALEFLAWLFNEDMRRGSKQVWLYPYAPPPWLNTPGQVLCFTIEGWLDNPREVADFLMRMMADYIPPEEDDEGGERE